MNACEALKQHLKDILAVKILGVISSNFVLPPPWHSIQSYRWGIKRDDTALRDRQSSWIQIQRSGFHSRSYQIFWEVAGLERGTLSLLSTIEELLRRKSSGSGLESREHGRKNPSRWPRGTLYPQKLAITSPTSSGRSVDIIRSRTQTMEFVCLFVQSQ
jgi:hypothetical protein